jgi:hypothetical protein
MGTIQKYKVNLNKNEFYVLYPLSLNSFFYGFNMWFFGNLFHAAWQENFA